MDKGSIPEGKSQKLKAKKLKRLWVITELYYPENNQTGYYLTGIGEGLTEIFDVKVICGQPNYAARGTRAPKREVHKAVEIFRVWGTTLDKDVLIYRLINMLTLGISMFLKTLTKVKKTDEILVVSAPPTLPFITALAAKICKSEYTLVIQDKYPETLTAVGKSRPDSLFVKFLNKSNRWLYREAKNIIVVGRDMRELVKSQLTSAGDGDKDNTPIEVIPNWASLEEIEPLPRDANPILRELNLLDKFVFLYAGNMGHPQDIESVVACAAELKNDKRFHFLFIGSGVKRKWLLNEVKTKHLTNLTILAPRSRNEQNVFLNACDVGLVPLIKKMRGVAMPSRTYNFLAAGKPILVLTEENSELAQILDEDKVGWYVPPSAPEKLLKKIYQIYNEREKIKEMGCLARRIAIEKYSVETAIERYKKVMK